MRSCFACIMACAVAAQMAAQSPMIYSNGPLITGPHATVAGANASLLQSGAPPAGLSLNIFGWRADAPFMTDDFTVCNGMVIDGIEIFGYAVGAVPAPPAPVTAVFVAISSTDPNVAITPVTNSPVLTSNQFANSTITFTNIYRVGNTDPAATSRAIMSMRVNLANAIVLSPGTYWIVYRFAGVSFSSPVAVLGAQSTGNARLGNVGSFIPVYDTGLPPGAIPPPGAPQGIPFNLYGPSPAQLGSIVNTLLPSCGPTTIRVGGAPVPGGLIQVDLGGVTSLGLIGFGFLLGPTPFCVCRVGHEWGSVIVGNRAKIDIPHLGLCGLTVFTQGADFGGAGGCPTPPVTFTDTYSIRL